jgi:hypothetical protein
MGDGGGGTTCRASSECRARAVDTHEGPEQQQKRGNGRQQMNKTSETRTESYSANDGHGQADLSSLDLQQRLTDC